MENIGFWTPVPVMSHTTACWYTCRPLVVQGKGQQTFVSHQASHSGIWTYCDLYEHNDKSLDGLPWTNSNTYWCFQHIRNYEEILPSSLAARLLRVGATLTGLHVLWNATNQNAEASTKRAAGDTITMPVSCNTIGFTRGDLLTKVGSTGLV